MELGPLEVVQRAEAVAQGRLSDESKALAALILADAWLKAHPRGHIDIQFDPKGRIVTYSEVHPETGEEDGGTGFGPTLSYALIAAFSGWQLREDSGGLQRLRDGLLMRATVDRIELLPKVCDGEAMLSWRDGRVLAILNPNGPVRVSGDETDTILGALASAIANAIPKESR